MSRPIKIVLYVVCVTMVIVFGLKAKQEFGKAAADKQTRQNLLDDAASTENTNVLVERTNVAAENTNSTSIDTNLAEADPALAVTNQTNASAAPAAPSAGARLSYSRLITYSLLCGAGFVGLAFLLAR